MKGEQMIERFIAHPLWRIQCVHDQTHGHVVTWSSGAAEQLEAMIFVNPLDHIYRAIRDSDGREMDVAAIDFARGRVLLWDNEKESTTEWLWFCQVKIVGLAVDRFITALNPPRRRRWLPQVRPVCKWHDLGVGAFWDGEKQRLYLLPLPCLGVLLDWGNA